ncbi:DNA-binding protein [Vibrio rotiferianus]|uniref:baseplate complex protein n=1 Tax=Vibrio rotiferianus TaxID=190895 RepID=UPI001110FA29|nr:DNA-binding protein [Vibrio rotiferianus]TMX39768.1 DNA-binding protein [Vibrio rotiferianus]TMX57835.1 DNA-binding protein [Vibrio rotiferianus]TMX59166.1 DNA-binding protein [Vibrio rotiferianus]
MFALDGKTFDIKNIMVNFSREYKSQDMSGMSSMTDDSEQGEKAAELEISGLISFKHLNQLTELEQMSAAKDAAGDRKVYRVVNDVANAFKIKMAKFAGKFSVTQQDSQMAWQVSFRLKEHHSIAEQKEQRHKVNTKPEQYENTRLKEALAMNQEAIS